MERIDVTVSGPGGTFGDIMLIIKEALEAAGVNVVVDDKHPPTASREQLLEAAKSMRVRLVADHQPWGG